MNVGDTIDNLAFSGKTDSNGDGSVVDEPITTLMLSDYQRHALTQTKVLMISLCAEWCLPCHVEEPQLVTYFHAYQDAMPGAVKFMTAMAMDNRFRDPTEKTLNNWASFFRLPFDIVSDPQGRGLFPFESGDEAFPFHLVIRTKDMTIAAKILGADLPALKAAIDAVLAEPGLPN